MTKIEHRGPPQRQGETNIYQSSKKLIDYMKVKQKKFSTRLNAKESYVSQP